MAPLPKVLPPLCRLVHLYPIQTLIHGHLGRAGWLANDLGRLALPYAGDIAIALSHQNPHVLVTAATMETCADERALKDLHLLANAGESKSLAL